MRISDWSSDVCSSDLHGAEADILAGEVDFFVGPFQAESTTRSLRVETLFENRRSVIAREGHPLANATSLSDLRDARWVRSEEHTSELHSLMRNSYAVFCLKKHKSITKSA